MTINFRTPTIGILKTIKPVKLQKIKLVRIFRLKKSINRHVQDFFFGWSKQRAYIFVIVVILFWIIAFSLARVRAMTWIFGDVWWNHVNPTLFHVLDT